MGPHRRAARQCEVELRRLERRALVSLRPRSMLGDRAEYAFKHVLVRDVAYASLPAARRVRAHAEASSWIEAMAGDRLEEFIELVAFHDVEAAGEPGAWHGGAEYDRIRTRAYTHALRAASGARRRSAVDNALSLDRQALQLSSGERERIGALTALGDDCAAGFHGDDGRHHYEQALRLARGYTALDPERAGLCAKLASGASPGPRPAPARARRRPQDSGSTDNHHQGGLREGAGACPAYAVEPAAECQFVRDGPLIAASALAHMGRMEQARLLAAIPGYPAADADTASEWQAWYLVASGDPAAARAIAGPKALEGRSLGPQYAMVLVEALVALEDRSALDEILPHARAAAAGNALLEPFCDRALGLMTAARGDRRSARKGLVRALSGFEKLKVQYQVIRTRQVMAALLTARGGSSEATLLTRPESLSRSTP